MPSVRSVRRISTSAHPEHLKPAGRHSFAAARSRQASNPCRKTSRQHSLTLRLPHAALAPYVPKAAEDFVPG
jgi:hypothetical protein